jgi:antitoxin (DNA-binding transcriptional repressor) of toxin-antitoxin stability system
MSYAGMRAHRERLAAELSRAGSVRIHRHGKPVAVLVEVERMRYELRSNGKVRAAFLGTAHGVVPLAEQAVGNHPAAFQEEET